MLCKYWWRLQIFAINTVFSIFWFAELRLEQCGMTVLSPGTTILISESPDPITSGLSKNTDRTDPKYPYAFAKVCDPKTILIENIADPCKLGVYIDVFPIDGLPSDEKKRKKHLKLLEWDMRILGWKRISRNRKVGFIHKAIQNVAKPILSPVSVTVLVEKQDKDARRYSFENSEWAGHFTTAAVWGNNVKPRRIFDNAVKHKFEAYEFWIPEMYDEYLTLQYGDYMKLPPKEKQIAKHDFVAYWKE